MPRAKSYDAEELHDKVSEVATRHIWPFEDRQLLLAFLHKQTLDPIRLFPSGDLHPLA